MFSRIRTARPRYRTRAGLHLLPTAAGLWYEFEYGAALRVNPEPLREPRHEVLATDARKQERGDAVSHHDVLDQVTHRNL